MNTNIINTNIMDIMNKKSNELVNLTLPSIALPIGLFILFLVTITITLLFSRGNIIKSPSLSEKTSLQITYEVFLIITILIILFGLLFMLLPSSTGIIDFFKQTKKITLLLVYTISLIILFISLPKNILDNYGVFIGPTSILLSILVFYFTFFDTDYAQKFNVTHERIKTIVVFFCALTLFILYYNIDPGNYIKKYMGYSMFLTILLVAFIFIYLIILLTIPESINTSFPSLKGQSSFFDMFSKFSIYGSIGLIIFLIIMVIGIYNYPGGFLNDKYTSALIIILTLIILIVWISGLIINLFPELGSNNIFTSENLNLNLFKKSLLVLFGFIISGIFIAWLAYSIQNMSGTQGIISFVLNVLLIIIIGALIYNLFSAEYPLGNNKKNNLLILLSNSILYIPCLVSDFSNTINSLYSNPEIATKITSVVLLILFNIVLFMYYKSPSLQDKILLQGGKLLVNQPTYTNILYPLASYETLNNSDKFNYQYCISFWLFLNANAPNTNQSSNVFTSILNYGNKPNILYRSSTNTLMVTMEQKGLDNDNKLIDFDENDNRILLKKNNILLQKWNNIVINYSGGTLDIFLNNELIKSISGVVPYMTLDTLTIGENDGYIGGLCNLVYYNRPLTSAEMFYLYNTSKYLDPPVLGDSNESIISILK